MQGSYERNKEQACESMRKNSQIMTTCSALDDSLNILEGTISTLAAALMSVLIKSSPEVACSDKNPPLEPLVPLADELRMFNSRLSNNISYLNDIIRRLEV
jgi:hypothetical protein